MQRNTRLAYSEKDESVKKDNLRNVIPRKAIFFFTPICHPDANLFFRKSADPTSSEVSSTNRETFILHEHYFFGACSACLKKQDLSFISARGISLQGAKQKET